MRVLLICDDNHLPIISEITALILESNIGSSITITDEVHARELLCIEAYTHVFTNPTLQEVKRAIG